VNLTDLFRRQFSYDSWANQEVLRALQAQGGGDARSRQLFAHLLSAERLWLERLKQAPQTTPVWPAFDLEQCESEAGDVSRLLSEYLDAVSDEQLTQKIPYQNSKGEVWENTIRDILTHVIMHSAYHRGQIASHMRESGRTPAYTDFIHGVRQGWVE
jgi:uncharacterized damage-inducible protein DinB